MELYITEQGVVLSKSGDSLLIKKEGRLLQEVELKNVESIQAFGTINISTPLMKNLMHRGIELAYYRLTGELIGQVTPIHSKNIDLRMKQHDRQRDQEFAAKLSTTILSERMKTCIQLIEEFNKNRPNLDLTPDLATLRDFHKQLENDGRSVLSMMGTEGAFTAAYFKSYRQLFMEPNYFNGRSRRPPMDPANSALSFLYTLLINKLSAMLDGIGFDPYLGFYHGVHYGRVSLACDLVELIRAPFADWNTLRFFNASRLKQSDFLLFQGVHFKRNSLKKFLGLYAEEAARIRNYPFINKGNLNDVCQHLVSWLRKSIIDGVIHPL